MTIRRGTGSRRGFTIRDLVVGMACLVVAAALLASLTGATRDLSQAQVCADHLRQLFTGMTAYANQYNSYPPNAPYPTYMPSETVNGMQTMGWDPNIGFIMTHGLGLTAPATTPAGHFKWYGTPYADLPDVCKCPSMSPALLNPDNPETGGSRSLEVMIYNYALSYQTSGTCRAATRILTLRTPTTKGVGGRNPPIPDPTSGPTAQPVDNCVRGNPYVWVFQHKPDAAPDDPTAGGSEMSCYVQAVNPSEVTSPGRVYYLADGRDYAPSLTSAGKPSWPAAGCFDGWRSAERPFLLLGTRHAGYANVMYLDGRVTCDNQAHHPAWYDAKLGLYRASTFATRIELANIQTQGHIMPVLMVKGWEYFFDGHRVKAPATGKSETSAPI